MTTGKKKKVIAIFIAYKAEKSLEEFYREFPKDAVDQCLLVDDFSPDQTFELAKTLGIPSWKNEKNLGYGGNLKCAIQKALDDGADIIVDIHPDGEYDSSVIPAAIKVAESGAGLVLGNRFHEGGHPVQSGMYAWKVLPILFLNWVAKIVLRLPINDYHQGFRIYTREMLKDLNFQNYSDNYLFSFELLAQAVFNNVRVAQIPIRTRYTGDKRGASLRHSIVYTLGVFKVLMLFLLAKVGIPSAPFARPTPVISHSKC